MARIEHFAVYADDSTALKDFYVEALDLHVIVESGGDPPGYFLADDQGVAIEVLGRPAGSPEVNQRWVCHLAFWVDDFAAKRAELERLGMTFEP
jgi:glyoxylase I family protein